MIYAGIDFSMTCPAITVGNCEDFKKCNTFFLTKKKKHVGKFSHNIFGTLHPEYKTQEERFANISLWALSILIKFGVKEVSIEGYSMGSKGAVFDIGENTGVLKHNLYKSDINIHVVAPTQVKKFFTMKGNADKQFMYDQFTSNQKDVNIALILDSKATDNPVSDVIDSFAVLQYGIKHQFKQ